MQGRAAAKLIYQAAIKAVSPVALIPQNLKLTDKQLIIAGHHIELDNIDRIFLLGAGKASAAMAASAEEILGDRINKGFVVTSYGNRQTQRKIELLEAGHPLPDHNSLLATQKIKAIAAAAGERDLIIFFIVRWCFCINGRLSRRFFAC